MGIFDKVDQFSMNRDLKDNFRVYRRKSAIVFGQKDESNIAYPIMYLSRPRWISEEDFQELVNSIQIQFAIKK